MSPRQTIAFTTLLIVFARCAVLHSQDGKQCLDAVIPASKPRGVNQVSSNSAKPLFELQLIPHDLAGAFEVRIVAGVQAYAFRDVVVAMTTNGTCGKGRLDHESRDFTQILQDESCPTVVSTKSSASMTKLPSLMWTPPSCGCVQFRVVLALAAENYYYTEAQGVSTGPLAKRFCAQEPSKELTREQRLDALCHVSEKHTSRSILSSLTFRKRHQLDSQYTDRLELEMALELRRSDARMCCSKVSQAEKRKCFENVRYRRTDRFCQDGFPDVPFVTFRSIFMRSKERRCCSILGTYRYLCFAKDSRLEALSDVTPMDYSLDATDPVNDLADFATLEDYEEVLNKMFNISTWRQFGVVHSKNNPQNGNLKVEGNSRSTEKRSGSGTRREDDVKMVDSRKSPKGGATHPKATENESYNRTTEPPYGSKISADTPKTPKTTPSTVSTAQRTQANGKGGLSSHRSGMTAQNSGIYRKLPTYSKPRLMPETSAEKRKYRRGPGGRSGTRQSFRRSNERKGRDRKLYGERGTYPRSSERRIVGPSKSTGRGSRRLTSSERRYHRGFKSSGKSREGLGRRMDVMEEIDDEGGSSVKDTLNYLDRKMKRLELKRLCCKAGAMGGSGVYGSLSVVTTECQHSSQKYLQRWEIPFGIRKCRKQFIKCCMDEAKTGLTMSSAEFYNKALDGYLDSFDMPESAGQDDVFLRRDLLQNREKTAPKQVGPLRKGATVQEILEAESDRGFESMRPEAGDPRFNVEEYEEKTGPTRFDEEDNRSKDAGILFDDVTTKRTLRAKKIPAVVSSIKNPSPSTSSPFEAIDKEAEEKQEEKKDKDDDDRREERRQMKEDVDDGKGKKEEGKESKVFKGKEDEMIQVKKNSHPDTKFSKSDKIAQNNETDEKTTPQSRSRTMSPSSNQANNGYTEASRLGTVGSDAKNIDKNFSPDSKDEPDVSEMMHRKSNPSPTQSLNRTAIGSRSSSVHGNLSETADTRSRSDFLNEERNSSLIIRQHQTATPPKQYYNSRSRERSRFTSGTADNFPDAVPKRIRIRKPWRRQGGISRRRFRNSSRRRQRKYRQEEGENRAKTYRGNYNKKQAAMDSKEMAEAHDERAKLAALDSRELAARYDQRSESMTTLRHKDTLDSRTGGSSKRRRRHRKRIGQ